MPIFFTGESRETLTGVNFRAKDQDEKSVTVSVSAEAGQDYKWDDICSMASKKYDAGDLASKGPPPIVMVTTSDF